MKIQGNTLHSWLVVEDPITQVIERIYQQESKFITGRCEFIRGRCGFVRGRCGFIRGRCGFITGRCGFIRGMCAFIRGRCAFIRGRCVFITGKCGFITGRCGVIRGKCGFIRGRCGLRGQRQLSGEESAKWVHSATAPLGEMVRRCLGAALFESGSTCWARSFFIVKGTHVYSEYDRGGPFSPSCPAWRLAP
jgi:hypothetical protein